VADIDADGDGYFQCDDCNDGNANVHPGQTAFFATPHMVDGQWSWDYNCDAVKSTRWPRGGCYCWDPYDPKTCETPVDGLGEYDPWNTDPIPCGEGDYWVEGIPDDHIGCSGHRILGYKLQECR
jgi:hypothetical protein